VHMQLTLQFQELSPIYAEDYKNSDIGVGYWWLTSENFQI
jgi:hypothetical protein